MANKAIHLVAASSQKGETSGTVALTAAYTITFWFKTATSTGGVSRAIFSNRGSNGGFMGLQNNALFYFGDGFGGQAGTASLNDDKWHHAAFVMNGASGVIAYLNGVSDGVFAGTVQAPTEIWRVGYDSPNNVYTDVDVDELVVWNKALNSTEVTATYLAGFGKYHTADTDITSGYHFDDAATDFDSSNDLTLSGSPTYIAGRVLLPTGTQFGARISASGDDGRVANGATLVSNDTGIYMFKFGDGNTQDVWLRFLNVTIAQGSTINSAKLEFKSFEARTETTVLSNIFGDDSDNPSAPTTAGGYTSITTTTASVAWDSVPSWADNEIIESPAITSILQEIVDRGGFSSGNAVQILIKDDGSTTGAYRRFDGYDESVRTCAGLYVDYSAGGGGGGATQQTLTMMGVGS